MDDRRGVRYYTTDVRYARLSELLRMSPPGPLGKLSAFVVKVLRLPGPVLMGMAFYDTRRCAFSEIPELFQRFAEEIRVLGEMGFSPAVALRMPMIGGGSCCSLALLGEDSTVYANFVFCRSEVEGREYGESGLSFVSRDTSVVWATSGMSHLLDGPDCVRAMYCPPGPVEKLLETHSSRLAGVPRASLLHFDCEDLTAHLLELEAMITDFNIARRVFRPLTSSEVARLSGD